jgi:hypothetical protein
MNSFDPSDLAQFRASAASAGLTRDDALAVLADLELLRGELADWQRTVQTLEAVLAQAEADAVRWKRSYQTALDEREAEAERNELLLAEVAVLVAAFGHTDREAYIASVNAMLAGSYSVNGIGAWWRWPQSRLDHRSPIEALGADFDPADPAAALVTELAAELSGPPTTANPATTKREQVENLLGASQEAAGTPGDDDPLEAALGDR